MAYRSVLGNSQGIAGIPGILGFCQEFPRTTVADWGADICIIHKLEERNPDVGKCQL